MYEAANVSLVRTVAFVAAGLKHRVLPPLETPIQIVPLEITAPRRRIVLIGHYEQFQDEGCSGAQFERGQFDELQRYLQHYESAEHIIVGDMNVDASRTSDANYGRLAILKHWWNCVDEMGLDYHETGITFQSYGAFGQDPTHRTSVLDHCYTSSGLTPATKVSVLGDSISDHWPVMANIG